MTADVRSYSFSEPALEPYGPVRIAPTRHQIDDRFPILAFTIDSGGRPYFEVLLTTDRTLFDGASASRRTPSNFYAGREHGLQRGGSEASVYHVPSAVLQSFASAREIYYTAVAYDSDRATGPCFAQHPELLAVQAQSIHVAPDFRGRTMARVLSVPIEKLLRVRDDSPIVEPGSYSAGISEDEQAELDRADGEDGYGMSAALEEYDDGYPVEEPPQSEEPPVAAPASDYDYDDGFGAVEEPESHPSHASHPSSYGDEAEWAEAHETTFPAGSAPPKMLEDYDERQRYGDESGYEDGFDDAPASRPLTTEQFTPDAQLAILRLIGEEFESGRDGYSRINADGEFKGVFRGHRATGRWHVGLSWGFVQFTQDSGGLGRVLTAMKARDEQPFREIFVEADELIRVTTAQGAFSHQTPPRGPRVQPVGGHDLWEEPWLTRFRRAGAHRPFQEVQDEVARQIYVAPMRSFLRGLGLDTQRAVTMVIDRAIQQGPGGARTWILGAVSPIQTAAQRNTALAALGHADLRAFQAASGLDDDGQWGPKSHAALLTALRALPAGQPPIPIPTREQMLDAIVRTAAAQERPWAHRPRKLRSMTTLSDDVVFTL